MTFDLNLVDHSDSTAQSLGSNLLRGWSANSYRATEQFAGVCSYLIGQNIYPTVDRCSSKRLRLCTVITLLVLLFQFASASSIATEALGQTVDHTFYVVNN